MVGRHTLLEMEYMNVLFGRTYNDGEDDDGDDPEPPVYYYYYYYYLLQLSIHSVAVVLTQVQTKQIRINIHKRNNKKTQYTQYKTH